MIIKRVKTPTQEGYFVKVGRNYYRVNFDFDQSVKFPEIIEEKAVRLNETKLILEDEEDINNYIG